MKTIISIAGKAIMAISLLFVVIAVSRLGLDPEMITSPFATAAGCTLGMFLIAASEYFMACSWGNLLGSIGDSKVSGREMYRVYLKANLGKYLPGNVMHYVERNLFAAKAGLDQKDVLVSSILEVAGVAAMALIIAAVFTFDELKTAVSAVWHPRLPLLFASGMLVMLVLAVIGWLKFGKKCKALIERYLNRAVLCGYAVSSLGYIAFLLCGAITLLLLFCILYPGAMFYMEWREIMASYVIAWVVGFVVPGAPGGIGVREFLLLYMLRDKIPGDTITATILLHRLSTILGDFFAYLSINMFDLVCKRRMI